MSVSHSLWDLNSSRLYISHRRRLVLQASSFTSLRDRSSVSKAYFASSLVIIAFTHRDTDTAQASWVDGVKHRNASLIAQGERQPCIPIGRQNREALTEHDLQASRHKSKSGASGPIAWRRPPLLSGGALPNLSGTNACTLSTMIDPTLIEALD
jgi:hypothetical protein